MVKTKYTGIMFDLDGVLVPAPDWHRKAFDMALEDFGGIALNDDEHNKIYNGLSTIKKLEKLASEKRIDEKNISLINKQKQEYTIQIIKENCRPILRIKEIVFWLYFNGFRTGVVTNCSKLTTHMMLKLSGLIGCWYTTITNNDVEGHIKPHPWPYMKAMEQMRCFPDNCLAIDDTEHGVESAKKALVGQVWHLENFSDLTLPNLKSRLGL